MRCDYGITQNISVIRIFESIGFVEYLPLSNSSHQSFYSIPISNELMHLQFLCHCLGL